MDNVSTDAEDRGQETLKNILLAFQKEFGHGPVRRAIHDFKTECVDWENEQCSDCRSKSGNLMLCPTCNKVVCEDCLQASHKCFLKGEKDEVET